MNKPLHLLRGFTPSIDQRIRDVKENVKASWSAYLTNELKELDILPRLNSWDSGSCYCEQHIPKVDAPT